MPIPDMIRTQPIHAMVTGFSVLEADSRGSLDELLAAHPHRHMPGASIDLLEFMPLRA